MVENVLNWGFIMTKIQSVLLNSVVGGLALALTSCGGSGGSGGSDVVTPATDTQAPSVSFNPAILTLDSGATGSTTVTAVDNIGVVSGPTIACTNGGAFSGSTFTAPVVTLATTSTCSAMASDEAGNIGEGMLTVSINPIPTVVQSQRAGEVVGTFNPPLNLLIGNGAVAGVREGQGDAVFATREVSTGGVEVLAIGGGSSVPVLYDRDDIILVEGTYESVDFIQTPSLAANGLPSASLSILSSAENTLYWNSQDSLANDTFEQVETIEVENPCFVSGSNVSFGDDVIIGQRSNGISLFIVDADEGTFAPRNSFTPRFVSRAGGDRSICSFVKKIPRDVEIDNDVSFTSIFSPLTAIDFDTNELVFFGPTNGDNTIRELGSTPLLTESDQPLEIVDVLVRGTPNQAPRYFLILLTSGEHNGDHRLMLVSFNSDNELSQTVIHAWDEGVPIGLAQSQFGGSRELGFARPDLVVALGTSEQSFYFDNLRPAADAFNMPPVYGTPALFDVGLGAGSVVAGKIPDFDSTDSSVGARDDGVLISFPDTGEVRFFDPAD